MENVTLEIERFKNKVQEEKRNTWTRNDIISYNDKDYAEVVIRDKSQKIVGVSKIDKNDISIIADKKWHLCAGGKYVSSRISGKDIRMHRFLMNPKDGMVVDHINHNKLDNRKKNLKIVDTSDNNKNKRSFPIRIFNVD